MNNLLKGFFISSMSIFFTACTSALPRPTVTPLQVSHVTLAATTIHASSTPVPTHTPTRQPEIATPSLASATPFATPSPTKSSTATSTPLPAPTRTLRPTSTPSTTPVAHIAWPNWVVDPETAVYMGFMYEGWGDDSGIPTLLNAATGERFVIELPYVDRMAWIAAEEGLYLQLIRYQSSGRDNSEGFNEYVNMMTGELIRLPFGDESAPRPLPTMTPSFLSPENGSGVRYEVGNHEVRLINETSGEQILLADPFNGRYSANMTLRWSGDGNYLGVWQNDETVGDFVVYGSNGTIAATYEHVGQPLWSPNSTPYLLYSDSYHEDRLCLVQVANQIIDCDPLTLWQQENESKAYAYRWLPDGQSLAFLYGSLDERRGGLCLFQLQNHEIHCLIDKAVNAGSFMAFYGSLPVDTHLVFGYGNDAEPWIDDVLPERDYCILNLSSYTHFCMDEMEASAGTYYRWYNVSPDGNKLAFVRVGQEPWPARESLCLFDLRTELVDCPVTPADIDELYIVGTGWSPDGRFMTIQYNAQGLYSDDGTSTQFGILDLDRHQFRPEGFIYIEFNLNRFWRPPMP